MAVQYLSKNLLTSEFLKLKFSTGENWCPLVSVNEILGEKISVKFLEAKSSVSPVVSGATVVVPSLCISASPVGLGCVLACGIPTSSSGSSLESSMLSALLTKAGAEYLLLSSILLSTTLKIFLENPDDAGVI